MSREKVALRADPADSPPDGGVTDKAVSSASGSCRSFCSFQDKPSIFPFRGFPHDRQDPMPGSILAPHQSHRELVSLRVGADVFCGAPHLKQNFARG